MKLSTILKLPTLRLILFLHDKGEVRYSELDKLISSRGTLSLSLKELEQEGLVQRRIVTSKPIQAYYSLTGNGRDAAKRLREIEMLLRRHKD